MQRGLVKGMIIGGLVASSVSMWMNSNMGSAGAKRKIRKYGKSFIRKSSIIADDIADLFR